MTKNGGPIFWWDEKAHLGIMMFRKNEMGTFSMLYGVVVGACKPITPADKQEYDLGHGLNRDWQQLEFEGEAAIYEPQ